MANKGLSFIDGQTSGLETAIAVGDGARIATFRATVQNSAGYETFDSVILRLANGNDNSAPFDDLRFEWDRAGNSFAEIGADASAMASISPSSASDCSGTVCNLDFKIIFNRSFSATSTLYSGQLYSSDTGGPANTDEDTYLNLFQVKKSWLEQQHYRWRNDDGGG